MKIKKINLTNIDALILVDIQNDFLPGGNLAVKDGDQVIPVLNQYIQIFTEKKLPVIATRDWHPSDHCSFMQYGGTWPSHCVQNTIGAAFADSLSLPGSGIIISKATSPDEEAYSALDHTDLDHQLSSMGVQQVWVGGLATDYCVLNTVMDFISCGYKVNLMTDAIRAVNLNPNDGPDAEREMVSLGARPVILENLL